MGLLDNINDNANIDNATIKPPIENATLHLELSNICNHQCVFCSNKTMPRKKQQMSESLAYRLLHEAGQLGIKKVALFMNGEPFATKHLPGYIAYAKMQNIPYVYITTNGSLPNSQMWLNSIWGGVDSIKFSVNAGNRETYKKIHGQDDFDKVIENIKFLSDFRQKNKADFKLYISSVVTKNTYLELTEFADTIKDYADEIVFYAVSNRGGTTNETYDASRLIDGYVSGAIPIITEEINLPCSFLFNDICVTCEGFLTWCCNDEYNLLVSENLNDMTLKEAWYSERMAQARYLHLNKQIYGTQCVNCIYNRNDAVMPMRQDLTGF